jgi:chromosome partitioning protein
MIVAIGGPKGGSGKTTLAFSLAGLRQKNKGLGTVLLIDSDTRTASSSKWAAIRSSKESLDRISVVQKSGVKDFIQAVMSLSEKYDDILIDVGGGNEGELRAAMTVADVFLNPLQPSQMDAFTIGTVDNLVGDARIFNPKLRALIVPSLVSPNNLMSGDDLAELLELTDELENMVRSQSIIKLRKAHKKAVKQGRTIFELEGKDFDQKAIDEVINLYNEVYND